MRTVSSIQLALNFFNNYLNLTIYLQAFHFSSITYHFMVSSGSQINVQLKGLCIATLLWSTKYVIYIYLEEDTDLLVDI